MPFGMSLFAVNPMGMPLASGSAALAAAPVDERERARQVAREELGPERPVETAAVARPVQVETGVARHALHRIGLRRGSDVDRTAGARERRDERLEALFERDPLPSGDGTNCVALSLRTCSISSRPGTGDPPSGTPMLRSVYFSLRPHGR